MSTHHTPTTCCGYYGSKTVSYPVLWNPDNGVVQCHNCGHAYEPKDYVIAAERDAYREAAMRLRHELAEARKGELAEARNGEPSLDHDYSQPLRRAYSREELSSSMAEWMMEIWGDPVDLTEESRDRWMERNGMLYHFICRHFPAE